jgi:hypothetical protein
MPYGSAVGRRRGTVGDTAVQERSHGRGGVQGHRLHHGRVCLRVFRAAPVPGKVGIFGRRRPPES